MTQRLSQASGAWELARPSRDGSSGVGNLLGVTLSISSPPRDLLDLLDLLWNDLGGVGRLKMFGVEVDWRWNGRGAFMVSFCSNLRYEEPRLLYQRRLQGFRRRHLKSLPAVRAGNHPSAIRDRFVRDYLDDELLGAPVKGPRVCR